MPLSGATIRDALASCGAVGKQIKTMDELAAGADGALRSAPGLTVAGAAGFLATCMVESAWFRTTTEYGTGQRYAPHIGRTFIQITWPENYLEFGRWCKAHGLIQNSERQFVDDPPWLSDYRWAWLGPVQYMDSNGLWPYANRGDFRGLSQGVNGGNGRIGTSFTPNGWSERQKAYDVFLRAGDSLLPAGAATPSSSGGDGLPTLRRGDRSENVRRFQDWSNWYAWNPPLPVVSETGYYGDDTTELVRLAQIQLGVTGPDADGTIIGPRTNTALAARGYPNKR